MQNIYEEKGIFHIVQIVFDGIVRRIQIIFITLTGLPAKTEKCFIFLI